MAWRPTLTRTESLVCLVAGLGFAFDLYESLMTALIVGPALGSLGHLTPGSPSFNHWVGLMFFVPAVVGGLFGLLGGYLTDASAAAGCSPGASCSTPVLPSAPASPRRCRCCSCSAARRSSACAWSSSPPSPGSPSCFPSREQRERCWATRRPSTSLGGLLLGGAYFLAVTYADALPPLCGGHDAWRYTLLSGLIPALPLAVLRPFLPESPLWQQARDQRRPSPGELWQPGTRRRLVVIIALVACTLSIPYGALQHVPRIVPGILHDTTATAREVQQVVSAVFTIQELGSVTGRLLFAALVIHVASRRRLLRWFAAPCLVACTAMAFVAVHEGVAVFAATVFCAQALFNGMHSFWGNYLPRVFPTRLRGTGESIALNLGGRVIAVTAALVTTQLANVTPGHVPALRLAYAAGITTTLVLVAAVVGSYWLASPRATNSRSEKGAHVHLSPRQRGPAGRHALRGPRRAV